MDVIDSNIQSTAPTTSTPVLNQAVYAEMKQKSKQLERLRGLRGSVQVSKARVESSIKHGDDSKRGGDGMTKNDRNLAKYAMKIANCDSRILEVELWIAQNRDRVDRARAKVDAQPAAKVSLNEVLPHAREEKKLANFVSKRDNMSINAQEKMQLATTPTTRVAERGQKEAEKFREDTTNQDAMTIDRQVASGSSTAAPVNLGNKQDIANVKATASSKSTKSQDEFGPVLNVSADAARHISPDADNDDPVPTSLTIQILRRSEKKVRKAYEKEVRFRDIGHHRKEEENDPGCGEAKLKKYETLLAQHAECIALEKSKLHA